MSFPVTWFAGLFYLPRLFVCHAECTDDVGPYCFLVMDRKLFADRRRSDSPARYLDAGWLCLDRLSAYT
jgi:putative membrane protein